MTEILYQLHLSPESGIDGLVHVRKKPAMDVSLAEQRVLHETRKISKDIDFIFFRRFLENDVRPSQPVAYIIDNTSRKLDNEKLACLHHALWLNGTVPLLYVDNADSVDILSCVAGPAAEKVKYWAYLPLDKICKDAQNISAQIERFSALALADGTFWENDLNRNYIDRKNSAYNALLERIKQADKEICGTGDPLARRLLLLTIFLKYLEDREVFKYRNNFFSEYVTGANSFYEILSGGTSKNIRRLFEYLDNKFNGDIFTLEIKQNRYLTRGLMEKIANAVQADTDQNGHLYFWGIYNFKYIPAEAISCIFQHFTQKGKNTGFTPILLVNLMLDQVMALENLTGNEKIFDPASGSGLFLVSAFRRLVFVSQQRKNKSLDVRELMELLTTAVYGMELREDAAYITSLCLALAVCDAVQPEIIRNKLKFIKLIGKNIFTGGKSGKADKLPKGFDIILGSLLFMENPDPVLVKSLKNAGTGIPANQLGYHALINYAKNRLVKNGRLCMIQRCGFLYNSRITSVRSDFLGEFTINKIFDFVSINGLLDDENIKAVVIQLQKKPPHDRNKIMHLTFRGTISANERVCFEMDHYDCHYVSQKEAMDNIYVWKANLLGGGRLYQLERHLKALPAMKDVIKSNKWLMQAGLKNLETTENLRHLVVLSQVDSLEAVFWEGGFLENAEQSIGITSLGNDEKKEIDIFFENIIRNIQILRACLLLLGSGTLSGEKTTAYTKMKNIMNLPWPQDGRFDLLPWEAELLDDVRDYMGDYVKYGQKSKLLKTRVADSDLENYSHTFLRLMNKSYPKMRMRKYVRNTNLVFMFFSFSGMDDPLPEIDGCDRVQMLQSIGSNEQAISLQTLHITRILTGNTLIIVKPDNLRYWIRSIAVRDVDDTIMDIFLKRKK
jgi:hypothetical protein